MNPAVARAASELSNFDIVHPIDDVTDLARLRDQVDVLIASVTREITDSGLYEPDCSPIAFLRNNTTLSTGAAVAAYDAGLALEHLPLCLTSLEAGEIGFSHLALVASAWDDLGEAFDERSLLAKAKRLNVTQFRRAVLHAVHAAHPGRFAEDEAALRDLRELKLSPQENGAMFLRGWLEPEGASVVRAALEELAAPAGSDDDRPRARRLGDALVDLAAQGVQTELVVTVPVETLAGSPGAAAAETEWGALLSSEAVRRMLCESHLSRLVLDGAGNVVDYGRRRRLFSNAARRAMAARDGHCRFPRCDRPASWCEGHHRTAFAEGGRTDVNEGVLLCRRHHHLVHEGGWKLLPSPGSPGSERRPEFRAIPPAPGYWLTG